jgi:hypothetical protein
MGTGGGKLPNMFFISGANQFQIFFFTQEHKSGEGNERHIKIAIAVSLGTVLSVGLILVVSIFFLRKRKVKLQRLYGMLIDR